MATCGSGRATVTFTAKDLKTDAISSSFTPQVTVNNQVTKPIEVSEIVIDVSYSLTDTRTVTFITAGTVIAPDGTASFTADKLVSGDQYQSVRITRFGYFTEGRKADCLVTS